VTKERQKNGSDTTSARGDKGEALKTKAQGTELAAAIDDTEDQATDSLMEEILETENLKQAFRAVVKNKGAAGIDGITVDSLQAYLAANWSRIRRQLFAGTYAPLAVKRVEIPKPGGGKRKLGIPSVIDRFIQQAVLQVLQRKWDRTFSEHSYGFRPGRSAHQAIGKAQEYIRSGYAYVVDFDLEKFFDRVNHDILMSRCEQRVKDKRLLKLLRAYLNAGVLENGLVQPSEEGVPQGGPLSPLLSNLMLDDLDRELEKRGLKFVRFADDCNIYVKSERAGARVMQSITTFLEKRLRLRVNQEKSAVGKPAERKFLGFSFTPTGARRKISPQSLKRAKAKIRELTLPKSSSLEVTVKKLTQYLRGWVGYFRFCETHSQLKILDKWIRRRLRKLCWKQWRTSSKRVRELRKLGLSIELAAGAAGSVHGPWHLSNSPPLSMALSNAYFKHIGLLSLYQAVSC
jgi:RNA-directed DNA polymerase